MAALVGSSLSLLAVSAGWAAIQLFVFEGAAALSNDELDRLRGGFKLPNLPNVTVRFGFGSTRRSSCRMRRSLRAARWRSGLTTTD